MWSVPPLRKEAVHKTWEQVSKQHSSFNSAPVPVSRFLSSVYSLAFLKERVEPIRLIIPLAFPKLDWSVLYHSKENKVGARYCY